MFDVRATIVQRPPLEKIAKQLIYGAAVGLTKTAKEGQAAVQGSLRGTFHIRNRWLEQQTPVGIKIKPATKTDLTAEIYTRAPFLPRQQAGGVKIPYKHWLAVPIVPNARPNEGSLIPKRNLPANLKNAFVLTTKKGVTVLAVRRSRGKNKGVTVMYILIPKARIKAVDIFYGPIQKVVDRRLMSNIDREIGIALTQMR